jgi:hypothetical protein
MNTRHTGVTVIAIVFIVLGILNFFWSFMIFGFAGMSSLFGSVMTLSPQLSSNLWVGLLGMAAGAVHFITGIGLLNLNPWAWYLAFLAIGINIVEGLLGLFNGGLMSLLCAGIGLIIPVAIAIYLLKPDIRDLFSIGS